jgi:hypothetical protein
MIDLHEHIFEQEEMVWAPAIGLFILEFATIEDFLHTVISWYLKDKHLVEADLKEGLPTRLTLFKKIMNEVVQTQQDRLKLESSVEGVRKLITTRNLLAHNSLSLEMEETSDGSIKAIGPVVAGRRDPNMSLTLDALRLRLSEVKRHRNELADLLSVFSEKTRTINFLSVQPALSS